MGNIMDDETKERKGDGRYNKGNKNGSDEKDGKGGDDSGKREIEEAKTEDNGGAHKRKHEGNVAVVGEMGEGKEKGVYINRRGF